jgi:hypothetical protein
MKSRELAQAREARKKLWVSRLSNASNLAQDFFWMTSAIAVLYYTNFFLVIWESDAVNRLFFGFSLLGFGIFATITVYASFFTGKHDIIEVVAPNLIPIATAVGVFTYICAHVAFWPVWGWMTPLILFVQMFGYMIAGSYMPRGNLGSGLYLLLFVALASSHYMIPHSGVLH